MRPCVQFPRTGREFRKCRERRADHVEFRSWHDPSDAGHGRWLIHGHDQHSPKADPSRSHQRGRDRSDDSSSRNGVCHEPEQRGGSSGLSDLSNRNCSNDDVPVTRLCLTRADSFPSVQVKLTFS